MKTHKSTNTRIYPNLTNLALMFLLLAALAVPALKADAQVTNTWTGTSTVTNLWSDSNNWSLLQLPGAGDSVVFTNAIGSTNVQGAVNNVMDTNWTINSLCYAALSNNFQTTLIKTGQTLTVNSQIGRASCREKV